MENIMIQEGQIEKALNAHRFDTGPSQNDEDNFSNGYREGFYDGVARATGLSEDKMAILMNISAVAVQVVRLENETGRSDIAKRINEALQAIRETLS